MRITSFALLLAVVLACESAPPESARAPEAPPPTGVADAPSNAVDGGAGPKTIPPVPNVSASDAAPETTCRGAGRYSYGKDSPNLPCCGGLTRFDYQSNSRVNGVLGCWTLGPEGSYACLHGKCGDGACEPAEKELCGCVPDCESAILAITVPTFSPAAGTYKAPQSVSIRSFAGGAQVSATIDGSPPAANSDVSSNPVVVSIKCADSIVTAVSAAPGFPTTGGNAHYTLTPPTEKVATVSFTPDSGPLDPGSFVVLSTTTDPATICYTTDGSIPTCDLGCPGNLPSKCSGTAKTFSIDAPIPLEAPLGGGTVVVKAIACDDSGAPSSAVTTGTYVFGG